MAGMTQIREDLSKIYVAPDYAECVVCGYIGRVRRAVSRATAGMIVRCLHSHCYRDTRFIYLCDGFSACMAAHREVSHPIQCRVGWDSDGCPQPVSSQRLVGATLRDDKDWQKGFYCDAHLVEAREKETSGNKHWAKLPESAGYGMETGP